MTYRKYSEYIKELESEKLKIDGRINAIKKLTDTFPNISFDKKKRLFFSFKDYKNSPLMDKINEMDITYSSGSKNYYYHATPKAEIVIDEFIFNISATTSIPLFSMDGPMSGQFNNKTGSWQSNKKIAKIHSFMGKMRKLGIPDVVISQCKLDIINIIKEQDFVLMSNASVPKIFKSLLLIG